MADELFCSGGLPSDPFALIVEQLDHAIALFSPSGRLLRFNQRLIKLWGWVTDWLQQGPTWTELVAELVAQHYWADTQAVEFLQHLGEMVPFSWHMMQQNGVSLDLSVTPTSTGEWVWIVKSLSLQEERIRAIGETFPLPLAVYRLTDGVILYGNLPFAESLRTSLQNVIGRPITEFYADLRTGLGADATQASSSLGGIAPDPLEIQGQRKDGTQFWVNVSVQPLLFVEEKVQLSVFHDITAYKQVESDLRQREADKQVLLEAIPDLLIRMSRDGTMLDFVPAKTFPTIMPYPDMEGRNVLDIMPPHVAKQRLEYAERAVRTGHIQTYEYNLEMNHETRVEEVRIILSGNDEVLAIIRDVTERKVAETHLERSISLLEAILESTADGIIAFDANGWITHYNQNFLQMWHISETLITQCHDQKIQHFLQGQLKDPMSFYHLICAEQEQPEIEQICSLELVDERVFERFSKPQWLGDRIVGRIISYRDVTAYRQAALSLREQEAHYRAIVEDQTELICRYLPDGTLTFVNQAYCRYFDRSPQELVGGNVTHVLTEEDRKLFQANLASLTPDNPVVTGHYEVMCPDGTLHWQHWTDRALFDNEGNVVEFQAVGRDVTNLKQAEEALQRANQELGIQLEEQMMALKDAIDQLHQEILYRQQIQETLHLSEERYRSVVAALHEGVILRDEKGTIVACNISAEHILGRSAQQLIGSNSIAAPDWQVIREDGSLFPQEQRPAPISLCTGRPCSDTIVGIRKPDGSVTWLSVHAQPLLREGKQTPYAVVTSFSDITQRKRQEDQLRLLESVVVHAKDAIVITESTPINLPGPRILYVNQAFVRLTGYAPHEVVGKSPRILQGSNTDRVALQKIREALENWQPVVVEMINYRKDRSEFWVELSLAPVADSTGKYTHWIAIQRDITQRKQLETELLKTLDKERHLNELKTRFVSMTSHEFRTPLSIILSAAELLEYYGHQWTEDQRIEQLHLIQSTVQHMTRLLEDILLIGRYEAGRLEFNPVPLDLKQFVATLLDEMALGIGKNHHLISNTAILDTLEPSTILCLDEKLLRQILSNLLSNAIKYSPPGSTVHLSVDIAPGLTDDHQIKNSLLSITVQDFGIGVPEVDQPRLFEFFQRGSNVGSIAGTGLGLAIAKRCADIHRGEITFTSQVGIGTTVVVTLPLG